MNILCIGTFSNELSIFIKDYFKVLLPFLLSKYNIKFYDTFKLNNTIIDIDNIVLSYFKNNDKTIIFFGAGPWIDNKNYNYNNKKEQISKHIDLPFNNKLINHEKYYKLYDIWDQKIDFQLNVILLPNKFNGFLYRYRGEEMDQLISKTPDLDNFNINFYCNQDIFKNWKFEKCYDVLFYGRNSDLYPMRNKLFKICKFLDKMKLIKFKIIEYGDKINQELSQEINKSYLTIACKTKFHDRFLGRYQEIPLSYSCIIGDIPSRYRNILENNMIETNIKMNDNQIMKIILDALKNKKDIIEKTKKLNDIIYNNNTYIKGKDDFENIFDSIFKKI